MRPRSFSRSTDEERVETREDVKKEIAARLEVRRRFYTAGFLVVTIGVLLSLGIEWWAGGGIPIELIAGAAAPVLGTGVVLWWADVSRRAALYEEVGRRVFGGK